MSLLIQMFYTLRPIIDFLGVITLIILSFGSVLYCMYRIIKKFWKVFILVGLGAMLLMMILT